jgi:uncharacterized phage protein (TIGR02216 family)
MTVLRPFPWDEAIGFGLGVLRLSPRDFWAMTPRELAAAVRGLAPAAEAPGRGDLDRLMRLFPDMEAENG